jgi:hypothetical protein
MLAYPFDTDLTFAALMTAPDGQVLARYGTREGRSDTSRMSVEGLKEVMRGVLAAPRLPAVGKTGDRGPRTISDMPLYAKSKQAKEPCAHCHYAGHFDIAARRASGAFRKEMLYRYPHPENLGIKLGVDQGRRILEVLPGSPAARAGVVAGGLLMEADGQRVFSAADLQFALDPKGWSDKVSLAIDYNGKQRSFALVLPPGWRKTDISWRASASAVPPQMGFWGQALSVQEKRGLGISTDRCAIRVNFLFPEPKWEKTRGDLRNGDLVLGLEGEDLPSMTIPQFHSHFRMRYEVGQEATVRILRDGERKSLRVPCLDTADI